MKTVEIKKVKIVDCNNAIECEERLNRYLEELAEYEPVFERDTNKSFLFYVYYTIPQKVADGKADEYKLNGYNLYCQDCPHFVVPDDKRLSCRCGLTHRMAKATDYICDEGIEVLETLNKVSFGKGA